MSYTTTSLLGLKKAVPGSNQPFETAVFNENWDAVDAGASSLDGRLDVVEPKVTALETLTSSGTVFAATTAVTASNALKLDGRKLSVGGSAPVSPSVGDLWIQV